MAEPATNEALRQAIHMARDGRSAEARLLFRQVLATDPESELGLFGLAMTADDAGEQALALARLLTLYPENARGQKLAAQLGLAPDDLLRLAAEAEEPARPAPARTPPVPPEPMARQREDVRQAADSEPDALKRAFEAVRAVPDGADGVPFLPDAERAALLADLVARFEAYESEMTAARQGVHWVRKSRGRAGERDLWRLRFRNGLLALGIAGVLLMALWVILTSYQPTAQLLLPPTRYPTATPPTATATRTATPGATPTPSPTPRFSPTPSPTIDPSITPGYRGGEFAPTAVYQPVSGDLPVEVGQARALAAAGDPAAAIALLEEAAAATERGGNFYPYYYIAEIQLAQGDAEAALAALERGREVWQTNAPLKYYHPLMHNGFARAYLAVAQQAREAGDEARADAYLALAVASAEQGRDADLDNAESVVLLAEALLAQGQPLAARDEIDRALARPALVTDTRLHVARARVLEAMGQTAAALQQLYLALYIDPFNATAHEARIRLALAGSDAGEAVRFTEDYLDMFPESGRALRLLGDARLAERKPDLAQEAYERALAAGLGPQEEARVFEGLAGVDLELGDAVSALAQLGAALERDDQPGTRARRMALAWALADRETARSDAAILAEAGGVWSGEGYLMQARLALGLGPEPVAVDAGAASTALARARRAGLVPGSQADADALEALLLAINGDTDAANTAIQRALAQGVTGERMDIYARVFAARGMERSASGAQRTATALAPAWAVPTGQGTEQPRATATASP
jgi:Tfp pilus assembly protein PilF